LGVHPLLTPLFPTSALPLPTAQPGTSHSRLVTPKRDWQVWPWSLSRARLLRIVAHYRTLSAISHGQRRYLFFFGTSPPATTRPCDRIGKSFGVREGSTRCARQMSATRVIGPFGSIGLHYATTGGQFACYSAHAHLPEYP